MLSLSVQVCRRAGLSVVRSLCNITGRTSIIEKGKRCQELLIGGATGAEIDSRFSVSPNVPRLRRVYKDFKRIFIRRVGGRSSNILMGKAMGIRVLCRSTRRRIPYNYLGNRLIFRRLLRATRPMGGAYDYEVTTSLRRLSIRTRGRRRTRIHTIIYIGKLVYTSYRRRVIASTLLHTPSPRGRTGRPNVMICLTNRNRAL